LSKLKRAANQTNEVGVSSAYRLASRPLIKWLNLLATNPRMILLFALLLVGRPIWYFVVELTLLNLFLAVLLREENVICRRLISALRTE
jgi:hypothetical protein